MSILTMEGVKKSLSKVSYSIQIGRHDMAKKIIKPFNPSRSQLSLAVSISPEARDEVLFLLEQTGISSTADLIDNALSLYSWAVKERLRGNIIASVDETNMVYTEVLIAKLEDIMVSREIAPASPIESNAITA